MKVISNCSKTMKNIEDSSAFSDTMLARRIEYLSGFMLPERYRTLCRTVEQRTRYMTICMENTFHPQNASALVRNCEAFGVQELHAVEELCHFSPNVQIVRGTDKWVEIHKHPTTAELIASLRARGYRIVATSPHHKDTTPQTFDVSAGPFALIFGTEHSGISDEVMAEADEFLRIPMCGMVESLNVSASAAILLYTLSTRVRALGTTATADPMTSSQFLSAPSEPVSGTMEKQAASDGSDRVAMHTNEPLMGEALLDTSRPRAVWQLSLRDRNEVLYRWLQQSIRDPQGVLTRFPG